MARADSQPLLLTAELALPPLCTKAGSVADWPEGSSPVAAVSGRAYQHLRQSSTSPWQSLPIQGPLVAITHHVTPALPVVEPEGASQKVPATGLLVDLTHSHASAQLPPALMPLATEAADDGSPSASRRNPITNMQWAGAGRAHSTGHAGLQGAAGRAHKVSHGVCESSRSCAARILQCMPAVSAM